MTRKKLEAMIEKFSSLVVAFGRARVAVAGSMSSDATVTADHYSELLIVGIVVVVCVVACVYLRACARRVVAEPRDCARAL